jgi:hypothetical protein
MYKSVISLALSLAVVGCATAQQTESQAVPPKVSSSKENTKRVCTVVREQETGSNFGGRRICTPAKKDGATKSPS